MRRIVSLLLCGMLIAAGCSKVPSKQSRPQDEPAVPAKAGPVTLRIFHLGDNGLDAVIAAYQSKYPDVRIEKSTWQGRMPGTTMDLLRDKVGKGELDLMMVVGVDELVKHDILMPLDPLIQRDQPDLKPFGDLLDQMRLDGKLYDMPLALRGRVMVYNRDLFKEAGVPEPTPGWTWEQFRERALKLSSGQDSSKIWGYSSPLDEYLVQMFVADRMGSPSGVPTEKELRDTLQYFSTLVWTDQSVQPSEKRDWYKLGFHINHTAFEDGKAAMTLDDTLSLRFPLPMQLEDMNWDVAPAPTSNGSASTINGYAESFGIAANTKQADAAWHFLRFLTGPEGAPLIARTGVIPAYRTPESKTAWFERQPAPPAGSGFFFEAHWKLAPRVDDSLGSQVYKQLNNTINEVLSGATPWEDAVARFLQEVERVKAEAKKP